MRICTATVFLICIFSASPLTFADSFNAARPDQKSITGYARQLAGTNRIERVAAAKALVAIGPGAASNVVQVIGPSWYGDATASRSLDALLNCGAAAVPLMIAVIEKESEITGELRHSAGLTGIFKLGTNAIPGLEKTLHDRNPQTRGTSIDVLRVLSGEPSVCDSCVRLLVDAVKTEKDHWLRLHAIDALGFFSLPGRRAPENVCIFLREILYDADEEARITAACSLAKSCSNDAAEVVQLLGKGILSTNTTLVWQSAFALNWVGTNTAKVLPEIAHAITNSDGMAADDLMRALATLGDRAFLIIAHCATNSAQPRLRKLGATGLGEFGEHTKTNLVSTVNLLTTLLKDSDSEVRQNSVWALANIATERKNPQLLEQIADTLKTASKDENEWVRNGVKDALNRIQSNR